MHLSVDEISPGLWLCQEEVQASLRRRNRSLPWVKPRCSELRGAVVEVVDQQASTSSAMSRA